MTFSGINFLAILVSTLLLIALGSLWFGPKTLFPIWWRAMGYTPDEMPNEGKGMFEVFASITIAALVQSTTLALVIHALEVKDLVGGSLAGLIIGIGFTAAPALSHRLFAHHSFDTNGFKIWAIETFPDVINLAIIGGVIAVW